MSAESVRAKIVDLKYDAEVNLFTMIIQDIDKKRQTALAIKGTDWGITPEVPSEIISEFCKEMIGKEKNFFIEIDNTTIQKETSDGKKLSDDKSKNICDNLDHYPIREVAYKISKESKKNGDQKD